jgi:hypothetical protein
MHISAKLCNSYGMKKTNARIWLSLADRETLEG